MTPFQNLLIPLDGSPTARQSLGCALWLAAQCEARLHVLNVGPPEPEADALARLGVPESHGPPVTLHQVPGDPAAGILDTVRRHRIDLTVMTARGASAMDDDPWKLVGHVAQAVIEGSPEPVLLLPSGYRERLPWRSALVPVSGESATDETLVTALRMADALDLRVTVAHVAKRAGSAGAEAFTYVDTVHHELPGTLHTLVERVCARCTKAEHARIEEVHLGHGDVAEELLDLIERKDIGLLITGWHGCFTRGHAAVLKALLQRTTCPILLSQPRPQAAIRLNVTEPAAD